MNCTRCKRFGRTKPIGILDTRSRKWCTECDDEVFCIASTASFMASYDNSVAAAEEEAEAFFDRFHGVTRIEVTP